MWRLVQRLLNQPEGMTHDGPGSAGSVSSMEYAHVQWGRLPILVAVFFGAIYYPIPTDDEVGVVLGAGIGVFMLGMVGIVTLFSRLEVTVSAGDLTAAFGFGRPHRTIPLADIVKAGRVRNHWYYGFGIRATPGGWMYNVWGLDAVELELKSGKNVRIGTDDPDNLLAVLSLLGTKTTGAQS